MFRNIAYGGLALIGGAITGIAISSWATPFGPPPQVAPEATVVASVAQPVTLASASSSANGGGDCSPWEVSDIAMEATLKEMIRRGWRPPNQGEVLASFDAYGPSARPVDPGAYVPVRGSYSSAATNEEEPVIEGASTVPIEQTWSASIPAPPQAPIALPAPEPVITSEAATLPGN
jgi:hypothetical protein